MGASLCSLHVPIVFPGRPGSEVSTCLIFTMLCWQPPPCCEVGLEMEGIEPEPGVNWEFFYAQWLSPPYQGCGQVLGAGVEVLSVQSELFLLPLHVCSPPDNSIFTPVRSSTGARRARWCGPGQLLEWSLHASHSSRQPLIYHLHSHQQWLPFPCSYAVLGLTLLTHTVLDYGSLHPNAEL